ncbi:hypothetical protein HBH56_098600 [Parastagonospora nodorum]|uniref:Cutinase n=2 Tax=Phaeosphaeria nodorum (strain SN15 / ATCC MYA-4574 / FGSC 10173) TaxID=321614 RepID=A0A7U2ICN1_PHANO|nr:hypothetical protein SNOG_13216 [Parastagonospora nodorum SN15]KAH3914092.1 hypothetical protein HBH56_098600 [Parastagonospora nodorum]EAT79543.1 hypothetical protein SNOG_13216 [Parastagonospora nodorum SN15]KAH3930318.1 hypothetical protein HBH54_112920 [Parastagonospora nodorum]KAH3964674.1 hypothetical protein HBH51_159110 [Parastagonospora nodorum]KAH4022698.1 hypothetical protein HBI09_166450 [Parastagonospora nodorum]
MKAVLSTLALIATVAVAQQRCDAEYPETYCNTTEIVSFQTSDCKPFHVFIVRGSDEPYPGRQGNVSSQVCASLGKDQCGFENIEYPAKSTAWGKEEWCKSASKGASGGQAQVKAYSEKCPKSKLILFGFSQGASVAQDILGGGGGHVFECDQDTNPALESSIGDKFIAAVTFGAVARSRDQNYTIGDGKSFDGTRARTTEQLSALSKYSDRLSDYCHHGDPICAVGSEPVDVAQHLDYFILHNEEVVKWVTEKAKASSPKAPVSAQTGETAATGAAGGLSVAYAPIVALAVAALLFTA